MEIRKYKNENIYKITRDKKRVGVLLESGNEVSGIYYTAYWRSKDKQTLTTTYFDTIKEAKEFLKKEV